MNYPLPLLSVYISNTLALPALMLLRLRPHLHPCHSAFVGIADLFGGAMQPCSPLHNVSLGGLDSTLLVVLHMTIDGRPYDKGEGLLQFLSLPL